MSPTNVAVLAGKGISAIACGAEYTLAISENNQRVYSWGWCPHPPPLPMHTHDTPNIH